MEIVIASGKVYFEDKVIYKDQEAERTLIGYSPWRIEGVKVSVNKKRFRYFMADCILKNMGPEPEFRRLFNV